MYACTGTDGVKVLKNFHCEDDQAERVVKPHAVVKSYSKIDSTGEVQRYESAEPQVDRPARALTPGELHAQRCEDMYQAATSTGSYGAHKLAARMWVQMSCKGHCDDLYNIVNSGIEGDYMGAFRELASQLYAACR